jgi:hypothetical protein
MVGVAIAAAGCVLAEPCGAAAGIVIGIDAIIAGAGMADMYSW